MNGDMVMGESQNRQGKIHIIQRNYKHFQGGYGRLQLNDVYTCHGLLERTHEFEKIDLKKNSQAY